MPRFVILEHDHPHLHWDLMLEADDVLRTWRLAETPEVGKVIEATALGDHRIAYLDYEGPVSRNRGTVQRWDVGSFAWREYEGTTIVLELRGERCCGVFRLTQIQGEEWSFDCSEMHAQRSDP